METRTCTSCLNTFSLENFANAGVVNGVEYKRHKCKSCYSSQKSTRKKTIKEQINSYKKTLNCVRCGYSDYRALQFHHHNNDKDYNVSDMIRLGFSYENILNEISKCEVLCANCHQIEHFV